MSLVKIQGNASGTGIFTIASPNSNTNRTLTLPDSTGTIATTADIPTADVQTFSTAGSGTWTKPTGGQTMARIQVWSGGGGAGRGTGTARVGGGGGGGYNEVIVPLSTLGATETATVAAGGTGRTGSTGVGTAGGNSSFGSVCLSYGGGGGGGFTTDSLVGGGGGGPLSAGSNAAVSVTGAYGRPRYATADSTGNAMTVPTGFHGGTHIDINPGDALYGGGSGARNGLAAGQSVFGGAGGAVNTVGTAPGGGGGPSSSANGNGSDGAIGRIIVTSW